MARTRPHTTQIDHGDIGLDDRLGTRKLLEEYGAVGDGITDDSVAILAAVADGVPLRGTPGKTYKLTQRAVMASGCHLDLTGCTIDASSLPVQNASHTRVFSCFGSYGTPVLLGANSARGDTVLTASGTDFEDGDMVMVYSTKLFDSFNTDTQEGEICFVRSSDATTVTLQGPLVDSYATADDAAIVKLTPKENITIVGGTIIGPSLPNTDTNVHIFDARVTKNVRIMGTVFKDVGASCVRFCDSVFAKVAFCSFEGSAEDGHLAYGVSFGNASQDCIAAHNSCYNRRHFLTTTNQSTAIGQTGITRRIKFQSNVMYRCAQFEVGSYGDAIDSHGGCEDIEILDNTVYYSTGTGINFEGKSAVITGNKLYSCDGYAIRVHNETDNTGSVTVSGNKIIGAGGGGILIEEGFRGGGAGYATVECCNNNVLIVDAVVGINVFVDVTATSRPQITVNGNNVQAGDIAMNISYGRNGTVVGNTLKGTNGLVLNGGPTNLAVAGNSIQTTSTTGRGINTLGMVRCTLTGNTIRMVDNSTSQAINVADLGGDYAIGNVISGNVGYDGTGTASGIVQSNNATYNVLTSNVMRGFATPISAGAGAGHVNADNVT